MFYVYVWLDVVGYIQLELDRLQFDTDVMKSDIYLELKLKMFARNIIQNVFLNKIFSLLTEQKY